MENYIETSKMSEILSEEFMIPFGYLHLPVAEHQIQRPRDDNRRIRPAPVG